MRALMSAFLKIALSAASLSAGAAVAADLPPVVRPAETILVPEREAVWTGFYIGGHAGYGWTNDDGVDDFFGFDIDGDGDDDTLDGFVGGAQIGVNQQIQNFVFGVEADISFANLKGENSLDYDIPDGDGGTIGSGSAQFKAEMDWLATIRGRAGVTFDRFLVYATGGLAFTSLEVSYRDTFAFSEDLGGESVSFKDSAQDTLWGWTVGAGVEGLITPNLTARIEYLYVNFSEDDFDFSRAEANLSLDQDLDAHILRGGINFQFN